MIALANLFVLMNIVCVLLNLVVFIMGCQGIQFASSLPRCNLVGMGENKICFCCEEFNLAKCTEKTVLKLYHVKSCNASHLLLKRVLLALCAMSALTTAICLVVAVLHCLQIFAARRSCINESLLEGQGHTLDPDDSASPVLPPSYSAAVHSSTPQASGRMLGLNMVPLSHISGARIKGIEVFCFLDPPPPYEAGRSSEQEDGQQVSGAEVADLGEVSDREASQGEEIPEPSSRESLSPSNASLVAAEVASRRAFNPLRKRSKSDPVLHCRLHQAAVLDYEAAMQSEVKPQLWPATLQKRLRVRALRVVTPAQQAMSLSGHVLPFSCHSGLLHLEGCGDLSTFTTGED
ncbi:endosomal transmembrane epsin interactor 1 [Phalacrocorax carbo]|uniref:endosomal transmembrane epsin interactor 1 n=1 Tax=Phalacrocorax carbo TaxID=9209 RepID=UPI0031197BD2